MTYDGLDAAELTARLGVPCCYALVRVTSTLDIVHELAADGAPAGTVVLADEQVAGRGRRGRTWSSPPGSGIWLGFLWRPARAPTAGVWALRVGLAVVDALVEVEVDARLKWPNDVMVHDRKLAGILCEARWAGSRLRWIAVGVGMNVHGPLPAELAEGAIGLDEVRPHVTRVQVLERLAPRLVALSDATGLTPEESRRFRAIDWLSGRRLREPVQGTVTGVTSNGALLVATDDGLVKPLHGGGVVPA